jgi:hypothetical protein
MLRLVEERAVSDSLDVTNSDVDAEAVASSVEELVDVVSSNRLVEVSVDSLLT